MRFMTFVKSSENSPPPPQALMEAMDRWIEEERKSGTFIDGGGLAPTADSFRVRLSGGKITMTDGPFAETKEVIGGYAILDLPSKEAAIEAARKFMELHREHWPGWEGESEVRQIFA